MPAKNKKRVGRRYQFFRDSDGSVLKVDTSRKTGYLGTCMNGHNHTGYEIATELQEQHPNRIYLPLNL